MPGRHSPAATPEERNFPCLPATRPVTPVSKPPHGGEAGGTEMAGFDAGCREYGRLNRRGVLTAGALAPLGLGLADLLRLEAAQAAPKREMSCILVWLRGGPSSIDMWDMKPD